MEPEARFKEGFHEKVKAAVKDAVSITCSGHAGKIYILLTEEAHENQESYGYNCHRIDGEGNIDGGIPAVEQLLNWFDSSDSLRFISSIGGNGESNDDYTNVIGQGDYDDE